jgi:hypothetical protein
LGRESDQEFTPHFGAIGPERSYAVGGRDWTACEVVDPVSLARVLVFLSDGVARRVRHYPSDWRVLSADELHALSWGR